MITYVPDNLWGEMLPSIDNAELYRCCLETEKYLIDEVIIEEPLRNYGSNEGPLRKGSKTTAAYSQYNLLTMPLRPFQDLYYSMAAVMKPGLPDETHMLQCWLNVFRRDEHIDWHGHWHKKYRAIHGFYCVNVTPSFTEYEYDHLPGEVYKVESKEGLLVFGKSNGDHHRSSPWQDYNNPRVTIAFDIVPIATMDKVYLNHFLPF
jgi:hypothetical protein